MPARTRLLHSALSVWGVVCLLLAFWIFSLLFEFLPAPWGLVGEFPAFFSAPETYQALGITAQRVVLSLAAALVLGFFVAWLMARGGLAGAVTSSYVNAFLMIPSAIAALVALFVFRRDPLAVYVVVVLIILPFISITLVEGIRSIDPKIRRMAQVYRFSRWTYLRHVLLPHLVPYAVASVRNENAHAWRVVVLAELFAVNSGMGWQFTRAWDRFLIDQVMLWLFAFMTILLVTEYLVLVPLEKVTQRWRRETR